MSEARELKTGNKAPAFSLEAGSGKKVSLKDFAGKNVVLYFYPKDNTSGCTAEACAFRDLHQDFKKAKTVVLGVSKDSLASHEKFIDKFELPFILLSDPECRVCEKYGVWKEKSMYGRKYMGIERSTFLIDKNGKLAKIWYKVKVKGHAEEVLEAVRELG